MATAVGLTNWLKLSEYVIDVGLMFVCWWRTGRMLVYMDRKNPSRDLTKPKNIMGPGKDVVNVNRPNDVQLLSGQGKGCR